MRVNGAGTAARSSQYKDLPGNLEWVYGEGAWRRSPSVRVCRRLVDVDRRGSRTVALALEAVAGPVYLLPGERLRETGAARDAELSVDVRQVDLDRLRGHVQRVGDVAVAPPLRREVGDAPLARGQRFGAGECLAPRAAAGGVELRPGARCERLRTAVVGDLNRLQERRASFRGLSRVPQGRPERGERLREFQSRRGVAGHLDGLLQQLEPLVAPQRAEQPQRSGERPGTAPVSCHDQLILEQRDRLVATFERVERQRLQRPPWRPGDALLASQAGAQSVGLGERLLPAALLQQQLDV